MVETTLKSFTLFVAWDPENDCDLRSGYTPRTEDRGRALKLGPLVIQWGVDSW